MITRFPGIFARNSISNLSRSLPGKIPAGIFSGQGLAAENLKFQARLAANGQARKFSQWATLAKTELVALSTIEEVSEFTEFKTNLELSKTSAHDIATAKKDGRQYFLKDAATNKEFPINAKYQDKEMAIAYSAFLTGKELLFSNIALSILGEDRIPKTNIVVDNLQNPATFFLSSRRLDGYLSLAEIAASRDLDEIFYVGENGRTRVKGLYLSNKTSQYEPFDAEVSGRIAADKLSIFVGDKDPNAKNAGIRPSAILKGKTVVCRIDFGCCDGNVLYTPSELAFSAPNGVLKVLAMEAEQYLRLLNRAKAKQDIFNKIGCISHQELADYVPRHFPPNAVKFFGQEIEMVKTNLLSGRQKFEETAKLHELARESFFGKGIVR